MKKGRISKGEDAFIRENLKAMTVDAMAKSLDRNPDSIREYIKKKYKVGTTDEEAAAYKLKERQYYHELKQQFTTEELELFQYHWGRIIAQFNNDVFPTEEVQIVDVIKLEILMGRCLKANKDNIEATNRLNIEIDDLVSFGEPDQGESDRAMNLERQLGALRAAQDSLDKNYRELQAKKSAMLKDMKATREQRIKRLEDAKESFSSWIGALIQDPERLENYGREMEKMRLAMEGEKARLSQYHTYEDGSVDQPFLNHETVFIEED